MQISQQTQAVLLLTAWLSKPGNGQPQPLTTGEWARFALWLHGRGRTPADLLANDDALRDWEEPKVSRERIGRLLERSAALAISVERWERAGLWILSRSDPNYPRRLRKRLTHNAPPILYGAGNASLLEAGGIAIVGSRDASEDDLAFAAHLGAEVAAQTGNVVSGAAKGVDESAMLGALEMEGTAVGVLAENLLRATSSSRWRRHLLADNLALISPFNPEARFTPSNAMARNKCVYCMADAAVVVASAAGKGGTWTGATENLRKSWVPLWVRPHEDHAGNVGLLGEGATVLPPMGSLDINALSMTTVSSPEPVGLPLDASVAVREGAPDGGYERTETPPIREDLDSAKTKSAEFVTSVHARSGAIDPDFYALFVQRLRAETRTAAVTPAELQERLELTKAQVAEWLKRALEEGLVERLDRPARYRAVTASQPAFSF